MLEQQIIDTPQGSASDRPPCVLPHADVQRFLLELVEQANFPGRMSEFVSGVKDLLKNAAIHS